MIFWLLAATCCGGSASSAPSAARSSSIALTPDETTVCVVNQDSGSISLWDWSAGGGVREISVGDEPRNLAVGPDGRFVYVTTQRDQTLAVVDVAENRCVAKIWIGGQPVGVVLSPNGQWAFVSQFAGNYIHGKYFPGAVAVVELKSRTVVALIPVKPHPFALALPPDGRSLYVTHYFHVGGRGIVTEIDTARRTVRREIVLAEDLDVRSGRGGIFNALAGLALHPAGKRALVVGMHANVRRGLTQTGMPLSHKTTVQAAVRIVDLETGRELQHARIVSSFSGQAVAVPVATAFLGRGEHFIDLYFASNDFKVIKYNERGLVAERALIELPAGPTGLAVTRDAKMAFFNCRWARSISQVSLADIRKPVVVRRQSAVTSEPWSKQRLLGAKVFHNTRDSRMTPNRWLSCGTCHLDGGLLSDHLVWEFTTQQKPTSPHRVNPKSLALTDFSAPPLLIRGNYQTVQEEDKFIRSFLGGTGFAKQSDGTAPQRSLEDSPELNALAEFVLSLRPRPNPHLDENRPRDEILQSALRGHTLFHSTKVGCVRCHRGAHWTRSGSEKPARFFDVGTGFKADVPSLQNVWGSAPYLHDGRAQTLRDVVTTHNRKNRHGRTQHLNADEISDLVHFLLAPFHAPQISPDGEPNSKEKSQ